MKTTDGLEHRQHKAHQLPASQSQWKAFHNGGNYDVKL